MTDDTESTLCQHTKTFIEVHLFDHTFWKEQDTVGKKNQPILNRGTQHSRDVHDLLHHIHYGTDHAKSISACCEYL